MDKVFVTYINKNGKIKNIEAELSEAQDFYLAVFTEPNFVIGITKGGKKVTSPRLEPLEQFVVTSDKSYDVSDLDLKQAGRQLKINLDDFFLASGQGSDVFVITAERQGGVAEGTFAFSFGNGMIVPKGIVLPYKCELIASSVTTAQGGADIYVTRDTVDTDSLLQIQNGDAFAYKMFDKPQVFEAGQQMNFIVRNVIENFSNARVSAWFRKI